jgi:hypothetical protein
MQCKAQTLSLCGTQGDIINVSVTDVFQQINGTAQFVSAGFTTNSSVTVGNSFNIGPDPATLSQSVLSWTLSQPISPGGVTYSITFVGVDDDNVELSCTVGLFLTGFSCSGSGGGNPSGNCLGAGPYTVDVNGTDLEIPLTDIHSSGVTPTWEGESVNGKVQLLGLGPPNITLTGVEAGTTILTFNFNGDECDVQIQVTDNNNGGSNNCVGGYNPPQIPLGGSATIQPSDIHTSGAQPNVIAERNLPNSAVNNLRFTQLQPINIIGESIGTTEVDFDFGGQVCTVTFEVVANNTGNQCFFNCGAVTTNLNNGPVLAGAVYNNINCGDSYVLNAFIPNPNDIDYTITATASPAITDTAALSGIQIQRNEQTGDDIVVIPFVAKTTGCSVTSTISLQITDPSGQFICNTCTVATVVTNPCDDCVDTGTGGTCTTTASLAVKDDVVAGTQAGTVVLGPVLGCDCSGCEIEWINSPDNPIQINIPDPSQRELILTIPVFVPDGTYSFIPTCCNCD